MKKPTFCVTSIASKSLKYRLEEKEREFKEFEDWKKHQINHAEKKKAEATAKFLRTAIWFLVLSPLVTGVEYLIVKALFKF